MHVDGRNFPSLRRETPSAECGRFFEFLIGIFAERDGTERDERVKIFASIFFTFTGEPKKAKQFQKHERKQATSRAIKSVSNSRAMAGLPTV